MLVGAADKKSVINVDTVISTAKQLEAYVLGKENPAKEVTVQLEANETAASSSFNDFENDIPY